MNAPGATVQMSRRRRVIARRLVESVTTKPPVTLHTSAPSAAVEAACAAADPRVTVTAVVAAATAQTLQRHPHMNAHRVDESIVVHDHVHLGIAVDTDRGLVVPVARDAHLQNAATLTEVIGSLAAEVRTGRITAELIADATFTISSLGAFGIDHFTPILDPPQVAVLGVGAIRNGSLGLSLTFDHAAVDGAPAARFLADLVAELQRADTSVTSPTPAARKTA